MHEALKGLVPLSPELVSTIPIESEFQFASIFFEWFKIWPSLYHEPFEISVPDVGTTIPDFATEYGRNGMVLYEVTATRDTHGSPSKRHQQKFYRNYMEYEPKVLVIEVNGGALECANTTMQLLEDLYRKQKTRVEVQQVINCLGRNTEFFQATLAREMARI